MVAQISSTPCCSSAWNLIPVRSSSPDSICQLPAVRCALKVVYHSRVAASDILGSDLLWTSTPLAQPEAIKVHLRSCQLSASAVSGACDLHVVHYSMQHWQTSILYALHTVNHYGSTSRWSLIMGQKGSSWLCTFSAKTLQAHCTESMRQACILVRGILRLHVQCIDISKACA